MSNMQDSPLIAITLHIFIIYGSCQQKPVKSFGTVCLMSILSKVAYTRPVSPKDPKQDYLLRIISYIICQEDTEFLLEVV